MQNYKNVNTDNNYKLNISVKEFSFIKIKQITIQTLY